MTFRASAALPSSPTRKARSSIVLQPIGSRPAAGAGHDSRPYRLASNFTRPTGAPRSISMPAQFGWTKGDAMDMGPMGTYQLFAAGGEPIGGMMNKPEQVPVPVWQFYSMFPPSTRRPSVSPTMAATILMGPMEVARRRLDRDVHGSAGCSFRANGAGLGDRAGVSSERACREGRRSFAPPSVHARRSDAPPTWGEIWPSSLIVAEFADVCNDRFAVTEAMPISAPCGGDVRQDDGGRCPADAAQMASRPSPAHALQIGVEQRRGWMRAAMALAQQLDLEAVALVGDLLRHIAQRDGRLRIVRVAARRHPAAHRAAEPDRLVADHVGIGRLDDEGAQPQLAAVPAARPARPPCR